MQAQVDRHHRFYRRGQTPREARFEQHAHGLTEARNHRGFARTHGDETRHRDRNDHTKQRKQNPDIERAATRGL
jgi:hypothetical protein